MIELRKAETRKIELLEGFNPEMFIVSPIDRGMQYAFSAYREDFRKKAEAEKDGICIAIIHDTVMGQYALADMTEKGLKLILFNAAETNEQDGDVKLIDGTWIKYCPGGIV